jgi:hypothetical protein
MRRLKLNRGQKTTWPCEPLEACQHSWPEVGGIPVKSLSFASCYSYSPRGVGAVAEASRRVCERVKTADPWWLPRYAGFVFQASLTDPRLAALFARGTLLVPIPGSNPWDGDALWPALELAIALGEVGLGLPVWTGLRRHTRVRKSATAPSGWRPSVRQHYESFSVRSPVPVSRLVLVDDVITKGRTLLAAAARLQAEMPQADIRAFGLMRTRGFQPHLDQVAEVCHGVVRWVAGDAWREP